MSPPLLLPTLRRLNGMPSTQLAPLNGRRTLPHSLVRPRASCRCVPLFAKTPSEPQKVWYKFSCASPPMPPHSVAFLRHEGRPDAVLFENSRLYTHCLSSPPRYDRVYFCSTSVDLQKEVSFFLCAKRRPLEARAVLADLTARRYDAWWR